MAYLAAAPAVFAGELSVVEAVPDGPHITPTSLGGDAVPVDEELL